MKKFGRKLWSLLDKLAIIFSFKNILSFGFAVIASISIFGISLVLPDKEQIIIILTIVGLSIAYSSFFVSNTQKLFENNQKLLILNLSKILVVSPIFPIFSILLVHSKADFGKFNMALAFVTTILSYISVLIFFFCFSKLLIILFLSLFKKK